MTLLIGSSPDESVDFSESADLYAAEMMGLLRRYTEAGDTQSNDAQTLMARMVTVTSEAGDTDLRALDSVKAMCESYPAIIDQVLKKAQLAPSVSETEPAGFGVTDGEIKAFASKTDKVFRSVSDA